LADQKDLVGDRELTPSYSLDATRTEVYVGDCRDVLARLPEGKVDLVFADPPFNWNVPYTDWDDNMKREDYLEFTYQWLDACIRILAPHGSLWVNIPDDWAAEGSGSAAIRASSCPRPTCSILHGTARSEFGIQTPSWCLPTGRRSTMTRGPAGRVGPAFACR